jgi:hypothetical protein
LKDRGLDMKLKRRCLSIFVVALFSMTRVGSVYADPSNRVLDGLNDLIARGIAQKITLSAEEAGVLGALMEVKAALDIRLGAYQGSSPVLVALHDPVYLVLLDEIGRLFQERIMQGMSPDKIVDAVSMILASEASALAQAASGAMDIASQISATAQGAATTKQVDDLQQQVQELLLENNTLKQQQLLNKSMPSSAVSGQSTSMKPSSASSSKSPTLQ